MLRHFATGVCMVAFSGSGVFAQDIETTGAQNAAEVFVHCIDSVGDAAGLRDWAIKRGLHPAPDGLAAMYLQGRPGQVVGADSVAGKISLIIQGDGGCTVAADHADAKTLRDLIEAWFRIRGLTYPEPKSNTRMEGSMSLTSTDYEVAGPERNWRIVISTGTGGSMEAIMTAYGAPKAAP